MKKLIPKVTSLYDLRTKAKEDKRYKALAIHAALNLGCGGLLGEEADFEKAMKWLGLNANETDEAGVVGEINFVRDMVKV